MIQFSSEFNVYLHRAPIDFRKQINGLSVLVQESMDLDAFSASYFVFTNKGRNRIKLLYWDRNGFCLWMKRLEKERFAWPRQLSDEVVTMNTRELQWLLEGFDIWRSPPHQALHYAFV